MSYEIQVKYTVDNTIYINAGVDTLLETVEAIGPKHFDKKDAKTLLKQTGSYSFSHEGKMITLRYRPS